MKRDIKEFATGRYLESKPEDIEAMLGALNERLRANALPTHEFEHAMHHFFGSSVQGMSQEAKDRILGVFVYAWTQGINMGKEEVKRKLRGPIADAHSDLDDLEDASLRKEFTKEATIEYLKQILMRLEQA